MRGMLILMTCYSEAGGGRISLSHTLPARFFASADGFASLTTRVYPFILLRAGSEQEIEILRVAQDDKRRVQNDTTESIVASTKGMIKANAEVVRQVVESDEYLYDS